ncbi:ABC transporter permease [Rhodococcus erythropolis]|uniref:ABC transporter permease n=1 Tax=Rhodococcus erythropolis TaxID=1833 RepID=UPI002227414F|nr:ABC transporter permease [Rhodococcus erythropolis]MCW2295421.1 ribose/xylose/arabinose/galactoside ABC-type transport system permease subunit [Rhodococcus erythropolis]
MVNILKESSASASDTEPIENSMKERRAVLFQGALTAVIFAAIFAAYGIWQGDRFLNVEARLLDVHQSVPVLFLGLAVLVTLICGLFDLSVASTATLSMYLTIGLTVKQGWPLSVALVTCIAIGVLVGVINAVLVEMLNVNTFIATLGTGSVVGGFAAVYSGGSAIVPGPSDPLPTWFLQYGSYNYKPPLVLVWLLVAAAVVGAFLALDWFKPARMSTQLWWASKAAVIVAAAVIGVLFFDLESWILDLPWSVTVLLLIAVAVWILLDQTVFGRNLYAVGSNRDAARLAGVRVTKEVLKAFVLGGVLASCAGITFAASAGSASTDAGSAYLLPAFSAAFLSTVVFSTGRFSVLGTIVGGIFVVWTGIGLVIGGLPNTWSSVVNGFVLIFAVAFATYARRRAT